MKFILGQKIEMTQKYNDKGEIVPITLVKTEDCVVTQVKTKDRDGYTAVQVGFGSKKHPSAAQRGHLKGLLKDEKKTFKFQKEFRTNGTESVERGDLLDLSSFQVGDKVKVTGVSKGRGFAGVVKRHHFRGHPTTHGHKDQVRMPGSIGAGGVQHVFKGQRMGGHMGDAQVTLKNLPIIDIDVEQGIIALKGALPGARNGLVILVADGDMQFAKTSAVKAEAVSEATPTESEAPVLEQETPSTPVEEQVAVQEETPVETPATEDQVQDSEATA